MSQRQHHIHYYRALIIFNFATIDRVTVYLLWYAPTLFPSAALAKGRNDSMQR